MYRYIPLVRDGKCSVQIRFCKIKNIQIILETLESSIQAHRLWSLFSGSSLRQKLMKKEKESVCVCAGYYYLNLDGSCYIIAGVWGKDLGVLVQPYLFILIFKLLFIACLVLNYCLKVNWCGFKRLMMGPPARDASLHDLHKWAGKDPWDTTKCLSALGFVWTE